MILRCMGFEVNGQWSTVNDQRAYFISWIRFAKIQIFSIRTKWEVVDNIEGVVGVDYAQIRL